MKEKNSKIAIFFIIFLFSVNLVSFLTIFLAVDSPPLYENQSSSYFNLNVSSDPLTLKVGALYTPYTLDPVDSWDEGSYSVIEQVVETLFTYDLEDPELPLINQLAESYTWINPTQLYITLRQGILFHDGTPFNAAAAKWNLDRLLYLTDCTGNNSGQVSVSSSLWFFSDGSTPIILSVSTSGEWDVIITLNAPYGPLLHLLTFINAGMLSPTSTPATEFIDIYTGDLVGTGPFQYDYYDPDIEVKYSRWDNYWKEPAYFEEISLKIFNDQTTANNAMLAYEIDMLLHVSDEYLPLYEADPKITLKKFTEDTGKPGFIYYYIGFNNRKYNQTLRKAMSFAIDYTYILDELLLGNAIRANSPISPSFGAAYNESATAANFDLNYARSIMQSVGFGVGFTTDQEWIAVAESSDPFLTVPYTYNLGNTLREDLGIALSEFFKLIGIHVELEGVTWSDFIEYLVLDRDHLGTFFFGWVADFLDPYNMLAPLFNPTSIGNFAQVDDPVLNVLLDLALETTDETTRFNIYKNIQSYLAEQGYFHAPIYYTMVNFVHLTEIQGVPYNARERFYAYPMYRATPGAFTLTSDAETPDDGDFTLSWTMAEGANTYSVYQDSSFIDEYHSGLTLVAEDITDLTLHLSGYPEGSYYFIVLANNDYGYTLSNCINIVVEITNEHDLEVNLDIPAGIQIDNTYLITASVKNVGLNDETNVELFLYLDEVLVASLTIPYLPIGETESTLYEWTPTEYKTYSFKAQAPPVPGETSQDDNLVVIDVPLVETQIFDGLYIGYHFGQIGYMYNTNFTYTPYQDGLFYETWNLQEMGSYQWVLDPTTRIMSSGSVFLDDAHTPVWIFTDTKLGEIIPIAVDGEGDHLFNVTDDFIYELPGYGPIEVWMLEDLTFPGGYAWYEKSTGILIQGFFSYYDGMYNYTLDFINTNAQFNYITGPGEFTLSSDAGVPDDDGSFTLSWTESEGADSYSVYQHSSFITEITGEMTLLAEGITETSLPLDGYPDGTYYFIVVAHNDDGNTLSNCIQVEVELKLPPTIIYDTVPEETTITYTRTSQIIGSVGAYSTSRIVYVGWVGPVDPGLTLETTYTEEETTGIYLSDTNVMTTNQLEPGVHTLTLRFYNADGMYYDKTFTVTVYRQAKLNLRGEFDYLLRERVKISIVALALDTEGQFLLDPITIEGMTVHIKISDYDGNLKVEDTMSYDPDGFFHWESVDTIKKLHSIFTKGIYIVQAWIEFPSESYYMGGIDIIEFHIDPPSEEEVDPWFIIGMVGFAGLIGVNVALAILLKRRHRIG